MLSGVRLIGNTDNVDILFGRPDHSYGLVDVDGLGPPAADINYSDYTILDGAVYHNSKAQVRNIVLTVEFQPTYGSGESVRDLRRKLYKIALPKQHVRVELLSEGQCELWVDGYVETHEPSIFTKNPQVQISIIAPMPYFSVRDIIRYNFNQQETFTVNNPGDVATGFDVFIHVHQEVEWVEIRNEYQDMGLRIRSSSADISVGRSIRINTMPGSKEVMLRRSDDRWLRRLLGETSVLGSWPLLVPGINRIRMNAATANREATTGVLRYYPKFGGY